MQPPVLFCYSYCNFVNVSCWIFFIFFFMCTNKILSAIMALSYYFELKNKRESQNCPPFRCLKATFNDYTCQHCSVLGSFERVEGQNFKSKLCCFINVAPLYSCQKKRKKKIVIRKIHHNFFTLLVINKANQVNMPSVVNSTVLKCQRSSKVFTL